MKSTERKYLEKLTEAVCRVIDQLDKEMTKTESFNRARTVAKLTNYLDYNNDAAMHYGLDMSLLRLLLR